jgi:hypothetical protein
VDAVLRLPWPYEEVPFVNSYMDLVENLVSANAYFAVPCLRMLVLHLTYRTRADADAAGCCCCTGRTG